MIPRFWRQFAIVANGWKILMSYIHGVYIDNGMDSESKINSIKNNFEAINVDLKLCWELCKWLLSKQRCAAVISVLNAFAETLLELIEEKKKSLGKYKVIVQYNCNLTPVLSQSPQEKKLTLCFFTMSLCFVETGRI